MKEFGDIGSFITHMAVIEVAVHEQIHHGLEEAAQLIEKTAKEAIGHYQEAMGPFPAWDQLAPSTLAYHASMGVGDSPLIVTGELYASIQHETDGSEAVIGSKMDIAGYQEFGTEKIPPRPFMGPAVFTNKAKIEHIMAKGLVSALVGGNAMLDHDINE